MRRIIQMMAAVLCLFMLPEQQIAHAQTKPMQWDPMPCFQGGMLYRVAVRPESGVIFTTEQSAVYRSSDGGRSWGYAAMYLQWPVPLLLDSGARVYTGTTEGVLASDDDGRSWSLLGAGVKYVSALGKSRVTGTLLAGNERGRVVRSTDRGVSWDTTLVTGRTSNQITSIESDWNGVLHVGTSETALWRSDDDGLTWTTHADDHCPTRCVQSIVADCSTRTLYVATDSSVLVSGDEGVTWVRVDADEAGAVYDLCVHADGTVYAGTDKGILRSTDGGMTWLRVMEVPSDLGVHDLACRDESNELIAATAQGVFSLQLSRGIWRLIGVPAQSVLSILALSDTRLHVALDDSLCSSSDGGVTWTCASHRNVMAFAVDTTRRIVYAANAQGVIRTSMSAVHWMHTAHTFVTNSLLVLPGGGLLAACADLRDRPIGVFLSEDQGATWQRRTAGLRDSAGWCLARNPATGAVHLSSVSGMLHRTYDDGLRWDPLDVPWSVGLSCKVSLAIGKTGTLIAGTDWQGTYRSTDDGLHWEQVNTGLPTETVVNMITTRRPREFWLATAPAGVFTSLDDGRTWEACNDGLTDHIVWSIAADDIGTLLAGTWHGGMFRARSAVSRIERPRETAAAFLGPNHPNPFTGTTVITCTVGEPCHVRVTVLDALGRTHAVLHDGLLPPGSHALIWQPHDSPRATASTGIYHCRLDVLRNGRMIATQLRPMLFLRSE